MNSLFVFFPLHQQPWHSHMMSDKGLNIFYECPAECVHLPSGRIESHLPDNKMCTPDTIANS